MKLVNHSGRCCGIKTIFGLERPNCTEDPIDKKDRPYPAFHHGGWDYQNPGADFFWDEAPYETYLERFHRLVAFCKRERPSHLIEVAINKHQIEDWDKHLIDAGFKCVSSFKNSNSSRMVYVYHLVYEQE